MGPTWASDVVAEVGKIGMRAKCGLIANSPQKAPGMRTDPPRSEPISPPERPAATAAVAPPDEPPGVISGSQGQLVVP